MPKKLTLKMVNAAIKSANKLHKETLNCFDGAEVYIKVLTHKDDDDEEIKELIKNSKDYSDMISLLIYRGILHEDGTRVFENLEQISKLPNSHVTEMWEKVNKYNSSTMEKEAKK